MSSDENVRPQRERRPQSAWNSRSGRRPQFTFNDLNETEDNLDGLATNDETRLEPTTENKIRLRPTITQESDRLGATEQDFERRRTTRQDW